MGLTAYSHIYVYQCMSASSQGFAWHQKDVLTCVNYEIKVRTCDCDVSSKYIFHEVYMA